MMKKTMAVLLGLALSGCISAPFMPPQGLVGIAKAPLSTKGNWNAGSKVGTASVKSVLCLYAWGDCSITEAARNGGLKRIDYVDYKYVNIIGIWQELQVFAYGE